MHRHVATCGWATGFVLALGASGAAQPADVLSVPVRIHDYARLPDDSIASAQQRVGALYAPIGVRAAWAETVHHTEQRATAPEHDPRELLIVILSPDMSRRFAIGTHAVGLAAVTQFEGGRVAYVVFDRVCDVAARANTDPAEVLGVIIAHEIGHLLLPHGSHSPNGLMRPQWQTIDFAALEPVELGFTSRQAHDIRGLLRRMPWRALN